MGMESNRNQIANPHSLTITHVLFIFEGVRECFAFAKPLKPTLKPKLGKECVCRLPEIKTV